MKKKWLAVFFSVLVIMSLVLLGCPGGAFARGGDGIRDGGTFDVIVVGSGGAGFGAVVYMLAHHPELEILFIEQNGFTGAMTRSTAGHHFNHEWSDADLLGLSGRLFTRETWKQWISLRVANAPIAIADRIVFDGETGIWPPPENHPYFHVTTILGDPPFYPFLDDLFFLASRIRRAATEMRTHMGFTTLHTYNFGHGSVAQGRKDNWMDTNHPGLLRRWHRAIGLLQDEPDGRITGIRYEVLRPNTTTRPIGVSFDVLRVYEARARLGVIMATGNSGQGPDVIRRYGQPVPGISTASGIENVMLHIAYARMDGTAHNMMLDVGVASHPSWWGAITMIGLSPALADLPAYGPAFFDLQLTTPQINAGSSLDPNHPNYNTHAIIRPILDNRSVTLIVDGEGRRWRGETAFYNHGSAGGFPPAFGADMTAAINTWPYWMIFSQSSHGNEIVSRYDINVIAALEAAATSAGSGWNMQLNRMERFSDEVKRGATPMELAANMGIPLAYRQAFVDMIATYDAAVAAAFEGGFAPERWIDPLLATNPMAVVKEPGTNGANLRRFNQGPFFALKIYPSAHEFFGGVITNRYGQALTNFEHLGGVPVAGGNLYAIGGASNRDHWGEMYRGGVSVYQNSTMGFIAVSHLMGGTFHLDD